MANPLYRKHIISINDLSREELELADLPVILMSGAQASQGRACPGKFAAVFDKPFDMDRMIATVRELLGT